MKGNAGNALCIGSPLFIVIQLSSEEVRKAFHCAARNGALALRPRSLLGFEHGSCQVLSGL